jgi:hypothetical protein
MSSMTRADFDVDLIFPEYAEAKRLFALEK